MYFDLLPAKILYIALIVAVPLFPVALLVAVLVVQEKWSAPVRDGVTGRVESN
jgi:hypothetical protein